MDITGTLKSYRLDETGLNVELELEDGSYAGVTLDADQVSGLVVGATYTIITKTMIVSNGS